MAFDTQAPAAGNTNTNNIPDHKKAVGYINMYLPTENGGKKKLGAITLHKGNANEARLAEWLSKDPEKRIQLVLEQMIVDYTSATPVAGGGFALPDDE